MIHIRMLRTTVLVDTGSSAVRDVYCSAHWPHDTQTGRRVVPRNTEKPESLAGDKGYDDQSLRDALRSEVVRLLLRHRLFAHYDLHTTSGWTASCTASAGWLNRLSAIERQFGSAVHPHAWYREFRQLVLTAAVYALEQVVKSNPYTLRGFNGAEESIVRGTYRPRRSDFGGRYGNTCAQASLGAADGSEWRVLLNLSVTLLPTNGVVGIDASGFDRSHASKHYTKRTKPTIQQLKVTLLVDTSVNAIIDLHVTTRKHDSQIAPSLIKRNTGEVAILLGDKGYDDQKVRVLAREHVVRPLIKHREFSSLHKAWNTRLDADLYAQRSQSETVNSRLKRKYGAFVRSRRW